MSLAMTTSNQLPVPLADPIEQLVEDFFAGRKDTTLRTYRQALDGFRRFVGVEDIGQAASALVSRGPGPANHLVLQYRSSMVDHGMSTATVNLRLAALRRPYEWLEWLGLCTGAGSPQPSR